VAVETKPALIEKSNLGCSSEGHLREWLPNSMILMIKCVLFTRMMMKIWY